MNKRGYLKVVLLLILLITGIFNLLLIFVDFDTLSTGFVSTVGGIKLFIESPPNVTIHSPQNITYEFNLSDGEYNSFDFNYYFFIDLNVSSDKPISSWAYSIYNENFMYVDNIDFTPNSSISVKQGVNELVVFFQSNRGIWYNKSVFFTVKIDKSAPILNVSSEYYGCEGQKFNVTFNITDYDGDLNRIDVYPIDFLFGRIKYNNNIPFYIGELYSNGILKKASIGLNKKTIYAIDDSGLIDSSNIDFIVLDTNVVPTYENLDVFKIWMKGQNRTFNKTWNVIDSEDGNSIQGSMNFNISYSNGDFFPLFNINNFGGMSYEANSDSYFGTYFLKVCATDNPILDIHPELFDFCGVDGSSNTVCDNFTFTISSDNRNPKIVNVSPSNNTINFVGLKQYFFDVNFSDEDGDPLSVKWLVDNKEIQSNLYYEEDKYNFSDNFNYSFGCGVSGLHFIKTIVSDGGNNNPFYTWNVSVQEIPCEKPSSGGGGGALPACIENWACFDWSTCQSAEDSFKLGLLTTDDYYSYKDKCSQLGYVENFCGFHIRSCEDSNNCSNQKIKNKKPEEFELCYYTKNPGCNDGIKNCHNGFCEIGIDCGGDCGSCPTCSDGRKNQEEDGIDCGGPCPNKCELETPKLINRFILLLSILFLFLFVFIIRMIFIIFKRRKDKKEEDKMNRLRKVMGR